MEINRRIQTDDSSPDILPEQYVRDYINEISGKLEYGDRKAILGIVINGISRKFTISFSTLSIVNDQGEEVDSGMLWLLLSTYVSHHRAFVRLGHSKYQFPDFGQRNYYDRFSYPLLSNYDSEMVNLVFYHFRKRLSACQSLLDVFSLPITPKGDDIEEILRNFDTDDLRDIEDKFMQCPDIDNLDPDELVDRYTYAYKRNPHMFRQFPELVKKDFHNSFGAEIASMRLARAVDILDAMQPTDQT